MANGILKTHTGRLGLATAIVATSLTLGSAASATMFTDPGTFTVPPWSETILGGGIVVDTRESAGGNPDAFLRLQTVPSGGPLVAGFYANSAATWNPSTQGAIASVDLGIDVILFQGVPGFIDGQAYAIGLEQGGMVFRTGFALTGIQTTWDSRTISGATQANFSLFNTDGTTTSSIEPNFSAGGGLITFGFIVANSGSAAVSGTEAGYDNWKLTVNPSIVDMPEPGTLALLGLGLAGMGFARRRRK